MFIFGNVGNPAVNAFILVMYLWLIMAGVQTRTSYRTARTGQDHRTGKTVTQNEARKILIVPWGFVICAIPLLIVTPLGFREQPSLPSWQTPIYCLGLMLWTMMIISIIVRDRRTRRIITI